MSVPKITLRPPPNVEFVQGYPGIPPAAPDRPLAGVKGTLEVRVGAQGAKAKWVRVELRKVETLPGGGQANTFFDFIGPSPINVWHADDREEWKELKTQDFPFFIRIPESIPPSIALERNAGIKYELIATVCLKGKKGLFRRATTPTVSTSTPIVIDKHELHSTWPVYSQPDSRHVVTDALTLTVDRTHTCYGPGDRVTVVVTIRNDNITTVVVRALEFLLKETIIFRAGPHVSGKKGAPQVRTSIIGEQKVPVNLTLYGGTQHRAELSTLVPQGHTTTTVTAARHIDITYSIIVNAVFPAGKPLLMELPITISNWPRGMSIEAVRRIGPTPNLSLISPQQTIMHSHPAAQSVATSNSQTTVTSAANSNEKNRPGSSGASGPNIPHSLLSGKVQGLGQPSPRHHAAPQMRPYSIAERVAQHSGNEKVGQTPVTHVSNTLPINQSSQQQQVGLTSNRRGFDEFGHSHGASISPHHSTYHGHPARTNEPLVSNTSNASNVPTRQRSTNAANSANRFTIANTSPEGDDSDREPPVTVAAVPQMTQYLSATEEKRRLQHHLIDSSPAASGSSSAAFVRPSSPTRQAAVLQKSPWPTAEEEKARLYESARAKAENTQASLQGQMSSQTSPISHGAPSGAASGMPTQKRWETAEQEKTRLFEEARRAVEDTHSRAVAAEENIHLLQTGSQDHTGYTAPSHSAQIRGVSVNAPHLSHTGHSMSASSIPTPNVGYTSSRRVDGPSSVGAQLYSSAMASVSRPGPSQPQSVLKSTSPAVNPPYALTPLQGSGKAKAISPHLPDQRPAYPSAEQEKSALRYYEAKLAVDRAQNIGSFVQGSSSTQEPNDEPIAYDALYPSQNSTPRAGGSNSNTNGIASYDAVTTAQTLVQRAPQGFDSAVSEKERMRRKYEEEESAAKSTPTPPLSHLASSATANFSSPSPPLYGSPPDRAVRSQPLPPVTPGGARHPSAAEEKARLKAQYEAEDTFAGASSSAGQEFSGRISAPVQHSEQYDSPPYGGGPLASTTPLYGNISRSPSMSYSTSSPIVTNTSSSPPPPPPLMPKPPAQYIQETQEVDARVNLDDDMYVSDDDSELPNNSSPLQLPHRLASPMDLTAEFNTVTTAGAGPSAPPRPPKTPVFD